MQESNLCAKRFTEEVSFVTENGIQSENYVMEASKRGKMEKYEFGRENPAESSKALHEMFRHDATMDFIERMKEND